MKRCWPRLAEDNNWMAPTDYFYADLTGNWDLNADGFFGDYGGDRGTGGVDFLNEVYVGRIPVYPGASLDSVLAKIITYGTSSDIAWRGNFMLPLSYSDKDTDGAYLGEAMINEYIAPSGMSYHRLYMQGTLCADADSSFTSEEELVDGATLACWNSNQYGMVLWWGHGSETEAALGYGGCGWGTIINSSGASSLDDTHPSFVFQCSCNNGTPEATDNLGTALLYNGAITTVSASRVSFYKIGPWNNDYQYYADNASIGYYYAQILALENRTAAEALFMTKSDMGAGLNGKWEDGASWMNLFDFNLYGDPSTQLFPGPMEPITIYSIDPSFGPVGTRVTIHGTNFGATGGQVLFSGVAADVTLWSEDLIVCYVPQPSLSGSVALNVMTESYRASNSVWFTVTQGQGLSVNSPNGGETWLSGSLQGITWNTVGAIPNVAIDYSIDAGQNWVSIAASTQNNGYYNWAVPATPSASCLIRISDASNGAVSDISDGEFSIVTMPIGPIQWARQYGGADQEYPSAIRMTRDGGFIIAGYSDSWGGQYDTYIIKLRNDGNIEWERVFKASSGKHVIGIEQTSDNSYLILGTILRPAGNWSTCLLKISEAGVPLWERILDVDETLYPAAFFKTDDDGCVIAGSGYPSDPPVPNWLLKVSPAGYPVWMKKFNLNQVSSLVSTKQANDGGIVLLANSSLDPSGTLIMMKLSADGEIDAESGWQHILTPNEASSDSSIEIVVTSDGGYGILGSSATGTQLWVAKLSHDGQLIWQNSYLGAGLYYQPESFQQTPDGGFVITGIYVSGGNRAFVAKLDSQGNLQWGKLAAFIAASEGLSVVNTSDFGYAVACSAHSVSFSGIVVMKLASNGSISPDCDYIQDTTWDAQATSLGVEEIGVSIIDFPPPETVAANIITQNYSSPEMIYCQGTILGPVITAIDPTFGSAGTQVEVSGSSFGASAGLVLFGSECASIIFWSDTLITCTVPQLSLSGMVPVTVQTSDDLTSDSVQFLFTLGGGLIVTSPNGGEAWVVGTSRAITWSNSGIIDNVNIDYSIDGGQTWLSIVASTPNTGTYAWTIPGTPSHACLVRVSDASVSLIQDMSDAQFSIVLDRPISLVKLGEWLGSYIDSIWLQDDYAYCGSGTYGYFGLDIINISNPAAPVRSSHVDTAGYSEGVCTRGSYSYFANGYSGLLIYDISDPATPSLVGVYDTPGLAYDVFVVGAYAYLIDQDTAFTDSGMLFVLDVSDPSSPFLVGSMTAGTFPDEIFIYGNHAYISLDLGGLLICDISDPASPVSAGYFVMGWSDAEGVFVSGNYAYLADWFYGLQIIDISDPANPSLVGSIRITHAHGVYVSGRYAYVAAYDQGLKVIDISNPATPALSAAYNTPGTAMRVVVRDNIVYIADSTSLFILGVIEIVKDDFVGTWDGQGVYYQNSDSGGWMKMASPATMITTGDIDGDGLSDIIGLWPTQGGIWAKYSSSGVWTLLSSTARHIATGDMNGDGRVDLLGTWDEQGVFYRNSITGSWVRMASPATMITSGDLDGDGVDDLIGVWPGQGGVWVKYSQSGTWARLSSTAIDIAAGDMTGDSRDDLLATWSDQGVYYRNSISGVWTKMASQADQVTCGHIDDDAIEDLIGIWPGQGGVWIKFSSTGTWARISSTARDISAGHVRLEGTTGVGVAQQPLFEMSVPMGGIEEGPEYSTYKQDLSAQGPGGRGFWYRDDKNLYPVESRDQQLAWLQSPGPGERGFIGDEQKNLVPGETKEARKESQRKTGKAEKKR
jgi:hypothetical protein